MKKRSSSNITLGRWGETVAQDYFVNQGFTLIERNFRTPDGEIDLIVEKDGVLVFIEVKTRRDLTSGFPEEAVTDEKLDHLASSAEWFLAGNPQYSRDWRLDVISIIGKEEDTTPEIEWFENVG